MKKNYLSIVFALVASLFITTSCSNDDDKVDYVYQLNSSGVFVLNEGSFYDKVDGSLSYLSYEKNSLEDGLFKKVNDRSLGGTPNDITIVNSKMFIAVTDENRVEILDASLRSIKQLKIDQPREVVASSDGYYVFITSYTGKVYRFSLNTGTVDAESQVIGTHLEGIAIANGYVYVANGWNDDYTYNTNIVKLNGSLTKVADIEVACNPETLESDGKNVYVESIGNYMDVKPVIQKIDSSDKVTTLCEGRYFSFGFDGLYVVDADTDYTTGEVTKSLSLYNPETGEKKVISSLDEVYSPCSVAVDPATGDVYVGAYNRGEYGASYATPGTIAKYTKSGEFVKTYQAGVGPCSFVFNCYVTLVPVTTEK